MSRTLAKICAHLPKDLGCIVNEYIKPSKETFDRVSDHYAIYEIVRCRNPEWCIEYADKLHDESGLKSVWSNKISEMIGLMCGFGDLDLALTFLGRPDAAFLDNRLQLWHVNQAIKYGRENIFDFALKHYEYGTDLSYMLGAAAEYNRMSIVKKLISHGVFSFGRAIWRACSKGHIRIIHYLLLKSGYAEHCWCLKVACIHLKLSIVEFAIEFGADNFNEGFSIACQSGCRTPEDDEQRKKILDLMVANGATYCDCGMTIAEHQLR